MIYASESRALCTAEVAVRTPLGTSPENYSLLTIQIPDDMAILEIDEDSLPVTWKKFPFINTSKKHGDQFILENRYAIMKVPSAVIPGNYNYLINPRHRDLRKIRVAIKEP